ncbi:unnamed protein product, partial [Prorocentrum cordatum]
MGSCEAPKQPQPEPPTDQEAALDEALTEAHVHLLTDLYSSYCPGELGVDAMVLDCEGDVLALWKDALRAESPLASRLRVLRERHSRP